MAENNVDDVHVGEEGPGVAVMHALNDMQTHMLYSSALTTIEYTFEGEPELFEEWLQQIEKIKRLLGGSDPYTLRAVVQTTGGYLGEFVQRFVDQNPEGTWEILKTELKTKFGLKQDPMSALLRLRSSLQEDGQSFQMFGEKLMKLTPYAFPDAERRDPLVQLELVNAFTAGIWNSKVRDKLVRQSPKTLDEAIKIANDERGILQRMDMYRAQRGGHNIPKISGIDGIKGQDVSYFKQLRFADGPEYMNQEEPMDWTACNLIQNKYTKEGKPICNHCKKVGHIWRKCYSRLRNNGEQAEVTEKGPKFKKYGKRGKGAQNNQMEQGQALMQTCETSGGPTPTMTNVTPVGVSRVMSDANMATQPSLN